MSCMKLNSMIQCLLALEFLLLPTLHPLHFMAQGRKLSTLSNFTVLQRMNEENVMKMRAVLGSTPPRCDNLRCKSWTLRCSSGSNCALKRIDNPPT